MAPVWLDFVGGLCGVRSPRDEGFAWCELGCGKGLSAVILASIHAAGVFHAVDVNAAHIAFAQDMATRAGATNLILHALDFAGAADLDLPKFDYIVAHGVYSWIDCAATEAFHWFVDRHLAPGGIVYVSYNAMPGWAADAPLQHLLYALAQMEHGDSHRRFDAASAAVQKLKAAGAATLVASPKARDWSAHLQSAPRAYFPHEYLAPAWRPRYVTEVRAALRTIGLVPIGSATLRDNFDGFVLRKAARDALEDIGDPDLRELARDYFLNQGFRRDVFARSPRRLNADERRERLLDVRFALAKPAALVEYAMATEAGTVRFDNAVARRLVQQIVHGPRVLRDCVSPQDSAQDVLANALTLCAASMLRPVKATDDPVDRLNSVLAEALDASAEGRAFYVLPCGMTVGGSRDALDALTMRLPLDAALEPWGAFFEAYNGSESRRAPDGLSEM